MVSEPFDPRLDEAILAEPTAAEPRQVLADFLEERGHPRAEFIRLALADKEPFPWVAQHRDLLGMLDGVSVRWLFGFADDVTLVNAYRPAIEEIWPTIATHRTYRFARELGIIRSGFELDPALPPPDGIRTLRIYYGASALASVPRVPWPRVTRLVIDQHISKAIADVEVIRVALDALPRLAALEVVNCLDETNVTALVGHVARTQIQSLKVDRLSEAAAQILIDSGRRIDLVTQRESVASATREKLHTIVRWRSDSDLRIAKHATTSPQHAPANFASLAPVTIVADHGMWGAEWAGSGVSVHDHPMNANGGTACGACTGTNTAVIWAQFEYHVNPGWGPDTNAFTYELVCRNCGRFTTYDA